MAVYCAHYMPNTNYASAIDRVTLSCCSLFIEIGAPSSSTQLPLILFLLDGSVTSSNMKFEARIAIPCSGGFQQQSLFRHGGTSTQTLLSYGQEQLLSYDKKAHRPSLRSLVMTISSYAIAFPLLFYMCFALLLELH
jgi:hypothetical protein